MTKKGLLIPEGYGRGMRYMLPQKGPDFLNVATSGANVATLDANVATSETTAKAQIKKRLSREELQNLILSNCCE